MITDQNTQQVQAVSHKPDTYDKYSAFTTGPNDITLTRGKLYEIGADQDLYYQFLLDPALFDFNVAQVLFGRTSMIRGTEFADHLVVQARTNDTDVRVVEVG